MRRRLRAPYRADDVSRETPFGMQTAVVTPAVSDPAVQELRRVPPLSSVLLPVPSFSRHHAIGQVSAARLRHLLMRKYAGPSETVHSFHDVQYTEQPFS